MLHRPCRLCVILWPLLFALPAPAGDKVHYTALVIATTAGKEAKLKTWRLATGVAGCRWMAARGRCSSSSATSIRPPIRPAS